MTSILDDVSRRRLNELARRANGDDDLFAELLVAELYDLIHDNDQEWFDAVATNGTKYEVKSAHRFVGNGAQGRFRVWEDQHRSLTAASAAADQTAWYAFVLFEDDQPIDVRRMQPTTVTSIVHDDGGSWNRAGHSQREGAQHKIPWKQVLYR